MVALQADRPVWFQRASDFVASWMKWFGYWAFMDLVLHLAGQQLGWTTFGTSRTPGEALFFDSWMATWFMLIFGGGSGKRVSLVRAILSRFKKNAA
jgi:hypothetical protein